MSYIPFWIIWVLKGEQIWTEMRYIFLYGLDLLMLTKNLMLHTLQSHDIRKMPQYGALHLHTVSATLDFISFTVPFVTKLHPCGQRGKKSICAWHWSPIHSFFQWTRFVVLLYCSETSRFQSLQSDVTRLPLSCSLFSECPAVTLHMSISSLFLVL